MMIKDRELGERVGMKDKEMTREKIKQIYWKVAGETKHHRLEHFLQDFESIPGAYLWA